MESACRPWEILQPQQRNPTKARTSLSANTICLIVGVLIGFMASTFLSMFVSCPEYSQESVQSLVVPSLPRAQATDQHRRTTGATTAGMHPPSVSSSDATNDDPDDVGWSTVQVYYGTRHHLPNVSEIPYQYFHSHNWFSQVRQDEVVAALLRNKHDGYFVDLAANDAIRISNTYALETNLNWRGLCIEPNAQYWPSLSYRKCQVVGAVVGGELTSEEVQFRLPKSKAVRGGLIDSKFEKTKSASSNDPSQPRMTVGLGEILRRFNAPTTIDFLSLDVEGAEELVLGTFPFDQYRFNVLTIERPSGRLVQILNGQGYVQLKKLRRWGETIWAHKSVEPILDKSALEMDTWNYKLRLNSNVQH